MYVISKYGFFKVWFWGKDGEGVFPMMDYIHREAPTETGVQLLFQAGGISKGRDIHVLKRAF